MKRLRMPFTLVELLVVVAVLAILLSLLLPGLSSARQSVLRTHCANNLRQTSIGLNSYSDDSNGFYPLGYNSSGVRGVDRYWCDLLKGYVNANPGSGFPYYKNTIFECKADTDRVLGGTEITSYLYLSVFLTYYSTSDIALSKVKLPSTTGIITDGWCTAMTPGSAVADVEKARDTAKCMRMRHAGGANILFFDGHADYAKARYGQSFRTTFEVK